MPTAEQIAIIDRDPSLSELLCQLLALAGYGCVTFDSAAVAIRQLPELPLCVILVELHLERRDAGLEVVAAMRHTPSSGQVPIVLWSADPRVRTLAYACADAGIVVREKPVHPAELLTLMATLSQP